MLVYGLIFAGGTNKNESDEMTVSYSLACTSDRSALSYDLTSNKGIEDYLEDYSIKMIVKEWLMNGFFKHLSMGGGTIGCLSRSLHAVSIVLAQ
jgi:hypothetical protein